MSRLMDDVLRECLASFGPYLDQVVIAGGWVPYLYGKAYAGEMVQEPLLTRDFDTAIPRSGFVENGLTLNETIVDAGFEYEFGSLENPPVVRYVKELPSGARIEIEFITDEPGNREGVKKIGSINAQALRYVGVLMEDPWKLSLADLGVSSDGSIRIPRPAAYMFHKILTAPRRRKRIKTAKDLYYVFYVLDAFPAWKADSLSQIRSLARAHDDMRNKAFRYLSTAFRTIDSEGVDLLLSQKPQTTFPSMSEDQFRQYAYHVMAEMIDSLSI